MISPGAGQQRAPASLRAVVMGDGPGAVFHIVELDARHELPRCETRTLAQGLPRRDQSRSADRVSVVELSQESPAAHADDPPSSPLHTALLLAATSLDQKDEKPRDRADHESGSKSLPDCVSGICSHHDRRQPRRRRSKRDHGSIQGGEKCGDDRDHGRRSAWSHGGSVLGPVSVRMSQEDFKRRFGAVVAKRPVR